jgi:perosamine synthetase
VTSPLRVPPAAIHVPEEDRAAILAQIDESLRTGQLTLGKISREFEERWAAFNGVAHAITVNSGTSALEIPLRAVGVAGGEVLVPANTFFATAAAVIAAGARPRFVDCDPATLALDPAAVRAAIGPDTVGAVVVHVAGLITPAIDEILQICADAGIWLMEDAAHAHGSSFQGRMAGTFGIAASYSFYPTKVMTSGEGGMIVTADDRIAEESKIYRDQGKAGFLTNLHTRLGYNWRMSEPHAAIGLSQFGRLPEFIAARQRVAAIYDKGIEATGLQPVAVPLDSVSNYYKYVAYLPDGVDRAAYKKLLREEYGVGLSGEVYEAPLHLQPVFEPWAAGPLPGAERICARHVCLPTSAVMTDEQAEIVLDAVAAALGRM